MAEEENMTEGQEENVDQDQLSDEWAAAMEEAGATDSDEGEEVSDKNKILEPDNEPMDGDMLSDPNNPNLDVILDIPVTISMEEGLSLIHISEPTRPY